MAARNTRYVRDLHENRLEVTILQQTIRLVVRDHGPVSIKEVKGTEKAFYDAFKQYFKDKFEQDLEPMECKRRRKFIKYFDDELEWEEGSWRQLPGL